MFKHWQQIFSAVLIMFVIIISNGLTEEAAAAFPNKPIKLLVPYSVGSGADMHARRIGIGLGQHLGVRVVIENKPGADGRLALNETWKAVPDGYTLISPGFPAPVINEKLYPVNYRFKEFTQLYSWSRDNMVLLVNSETWKTADEFISAAKSRPLSGGLSGVGSTSQIAGLLLEEAAHFKSVNWVVFGGGGESLTTLAGKHIDFAITTASSAHALVGAGKLRCLLAFALARDPLFSNAALPKEVGINADMSPLVSVRLAIGPPGMPAPVVNILERAFAKAAQEPDFLEWAKNARNEIVLMNHKQLADYVAKVDREITKYADKIKK